MTMLSVGDATLFVDRVGDGYPLLLMHGGPGVDHNTMQPFRALKDRFSLVLYDHRCNGRSQGADVQSMTWENLTRDADTIRQSYGIERWAVLGHSFGGMVALEYALRYPEALSHLILLDTGGDTRWVQENAPKILSRRGFSKEKVRTAERFFNGAITPEEFMPSIRKLSTAYYYRLTLPQLIHQIAIGLRMKVRPEALIYGYSQLLKGWSVMEQLGAIDVPALVMAGRDDFQFPPEHQVELAAGLPNARLKIIERAGHNAHTERPDEIIWAVTNFLANGR
jgi:proline iminopeptidase